MMDPNRWYKIIVPPNTATPCVNHGQRVLAMIRSLENEDDETKFDTILGDAMEILKSLIISCSRKGLLQDDALKAEVVLSSSSPSGRGGGTEGNGQETTTLKKKRGRNNKRDNQQKGAATSTTTTSAIDESLILSAVIRILSGLQLQPKLLPAARIGVDYCTAISEYIKSKRGSAKQQQQQQQQLSRINLAEYELLSSSGVPLLKALWKACSQTLSSIVEPERINQQHQNGDASLDHNRPLFNTDLLGHEEEISMLQSCLRAAASLVSLFGTKLSRSSGLISDWQKIGLSCLTLPSHNAQIAASKLLAALPLTGALYDKKLASKKTIGEQWSDFLMDAVVCLSRVLKSMTPIATATSTTKQQALDSVSNSWQVSKDFGAFLDNVNSSFREKMPEEETRASSFRFLIHGLFRLMQSVLKRDSSCNDAMLLDARISVEAILNLLEYMLSFSFASETLYFGTKKRLRLEAVDGGVLSPASIVTEVASYVQLLGHQLFDTLVSAVGHSPLLPHSKRILRLVSRALQTSASSALQMVDPSAGPSATQCEGGKPKRWLHTSITLRSNAVRNFGVTIALFGLDPTRNSSSSDTSSTWLSPIKSSGAEDCITVVGGCLLEQLWVDEKESRDWGTFEERVALAENAVRSLELILLSCGGFMPTSLRVLIESIAAAGLDAITIQEKSPIASSKSVKVAILRLGCACVSTPWSSGASSSVQEKLFEASLKCKMHDHETSSAALSALRLCEASGTPRSPALYVDKKVYDFSGSIKPVSASMFATSLQQGNLDMASREEEANSRGRAEDEKKEGPGKRRKIADDTKGDEQSVQRDKGLMSHAEKEENLTSLKPDAIEQQRASFPSLEEKDAEGKNRQETKTSEEEGEEEEDDFLPDILDSGGPDEEDS